MAITASGIYSFVGCPHTLTCELFGNPDDKGLDNGFLTMLMEQGVQHEAQVAASLGDIVDISVYPMCDRKQATISAMQSHAPLIYQGVIGCHDKEGIPDLLQLVGDSYYIPGDIKSGSGFECGETEKYKKEYAVQLAHYDDILKTMGFSVANRRHTFILDDSGTKVIYDLDEPMGARIKLTWRDLYTTKIQEMREIMSGRKKTLPALSSTCKLCPWYSKCKQDVIAANDLTLIAELGRQKRDVMQGDVKTIEDFVRSDIGKFVVDEKKGKTVFKGIGFKTLQKFHDRACLLSDPSAVSYRRKDFDFPESTKTVYFDIEADPTRGGFVYLHGFVEENQSGDHTFLPQYTPSPTPDEEKQAFSRAWKYLNRSVADSTIFYYSPYERVSYLKLANKYPDVCTASEVQAFFDLPNVIDLYMQVIKPFTEWKAYDQSIKTLAVLLGFKWRDEHPSGAASIQWFNEWLSSGDDKILQRILDYNEDDCLATGVVLKGTKELVLRT